MKYRISNYWIKLLLFSLFLGSIPAVLVGVFSYFRAADTIMQKSGASSAQMLLQTQLRVEQNLRGVDNAVTQFVNSPGLNAALHQKLWAQEFVQIEELSSGLHRLQSFQYGVQDVFLANLQQDWVISNRGIRHMKDWKSGKMWLPFLERPGSSFWLNYRDLPQLSVDEDPGFASGSIFLMKKLPANTRKPTGFILTSIPGYELNKYLSQSGSINSVAVLDANYRVLAGHVTETGKEDAGWFDSIALALKDAPGDEGSIGLSLGGEKFLAAYRKAAYNGWIYVSVTPLTELLRDSKAIGLFTLFICLANLVLALIFSFFGSRKMYSPIRTLYETVMGGTRLPSTSAGAEGTGNEFEQIGDRVRRLHQAQTELSDTVKGQSRELREYFVAKLLQTPVSVREMQEKSSVFGFPNDWRTMRVMTVDIHSLDGTRYDEKDRDLLMFAVHNIAGELFDAADCLDPVLINPYQATLFGTASADGGQWKKAVVAYAEQLQNTVKAVLGLPVGIGISRSFGEFASASAAFREAVEALRAQHGFDDPSVLALEDIRPVLRPLSPVVLEQTAIQLAEAVKRRERDRALKLLRNCFRDHLEKEGLDPEEVRLWLLRLMLDMVSAFRDQEESLQTLWNGDTPPLEQFLKLHTLRDYEHWFTSSLIEPMIRQLEAGRDRQFKSISQEVKDIIHYDFAADLTLELCAVRLNYHPSYIRQVFRKETGMNFSDYLAQYRLEIAKKWLVETDLKIVEIAGKLKYNNPQNFIRYFRKMEGITPGQYREAHQPDFQ